MSLPWLGQRSGIVTVCPASYMARAESLRTAIGADLTVALPILAVRSEASFSSACFELLTDVNAENDEDEDCALEDVDRVVIRMTGLLLTLCAVYGLRTTTLESELEFLGTAAVSRTSTLTFVCAWRLS